MSHDLPMLLVADDDDDLLEEASHWLSMAGYQVRVARHGGEAITALQGGLRPGAIILDLMMPRVSGWDVWDWVQAHHRDVPVIIWTATGLKQGAVGHALVVQKGRDPVALLEAIQQSLAPSSSSSSASSPSSPSAPSPSSPSTSSSPSPSLPLSPSTSSSSSSPAPSLPSSSPALSAAPASSELPVEPELAAAPAASDPEPVA